MWTELRLQGGEPSVPGGTKHRGLLGTLPGTTTPGPGPDEKGPVTWRGSRSLPCACSQPGVLILTLLGLLGPRLLQGAPAQRCPQGFRVTGSLGRLVREGCEQGQLCLPTCKQLHPLAPQSGPTCQHIWALSGFAPLDPTHPQYLQDLPLKRRVLESCFLVQF